MTIYIGRDGRRCHRHEWSQLQKDESYRVVRLYDNGEVYVRLVWLGQVVNPDQTLPEFYKVFALEVHNYDARGNRVIDIVEHNKTFPTESAGVAAYEAFLERWTASHREDGEFVEEDNTLAIPKPPPPPDPDAPSTDAKQIASVNLGEGDVGVW